MTDSVGQNALKELLGLLSLEKIEGDIFRGQSQDLGYGNVFGGQVLGQALSAASRTVPENLCAHSLHGYFLRAGDAARPIVYMVERTRDGHSFTTRQIKAVQKDRTIFSMSASFHKFEEGFNHQNPMPDVKGPEGVESDYNRIARHAKNLPEDIVKKLMCPKPIELRAVNPINPFHPVSAPPDKCVWFRATGPLPDDPAIHRCMLAYTSDFYLVSTALYPHARTFWSRDVQAASLDHAIWFHRDFRMDDWLLHVIHSPSAAMGRGLTQGSIYTRNGKLVASVAQEGLIRRMDKNKIR